MLYTILFQMGRKYMLILGT